MTGRSVDLLLWILNAAFKELDGIFFFLQSAAGGMLLSSCPYLYVHTSHSRENDISGNALRESLQIRKQTFTWTQA